MRCADRRLPTAVAALLAAVAAAPTSAAAERSLPVDCLPDAVLTWQAAQPDPAARFGARDLPGIVLGMPGESTSTSGTTTVASLGHGGEMVYLLSDSVIEDRPGPDFIVFENAFFVGAPPASDGEDYTVFDEPGVVAVSADGESWFEFPYDRQALAGAMTGSIDRATQLALRGLAGITPTFSGNWTIPDDPDTWDAGGIGGVSGAGGDAFDLATVGLAEARFVRLTDAGKVNGFPGAGEGFDLDAIVVLHGRPLPPPAPDADGDGLSDAEETQIYGSSPSLADTDADGTDDGREVAGCRSPLDAGVSPWLVLEPRLWQRRDGTTDKLRWTWLGAGESFDVVEGDLSELRGTANGIDLGPTDCLADDTPLVRLDVAGIDPRPGQARFALVRLSSAASYGRSGRLGPRSTSGGCP